MGKDLPSSKIRDIRGERFGRLLVKSFSHIAPDHGRNAYWWCLCDCGKTTCVSSSSLRAEVTRSCGCLAAEVSRVLMKKLHNRGKHLYFIQCGGYIKIGRTDNIQKRLSQLKAMNPYEVVLVKEMLNEGHREKDFHKIHQHRHHKGEWFRLKPEEIYNLCETN